MIVPYSYVKRFTAGAVFGLYMAYLLYFLNPQLDTTVPRVMTAAVIYSLVGGLIFGTILWLLRWTRVRVFGRRTDAMRQYGFGNVASAVTLSAAVYWVHLVVFRIFLPRGAVRVLSKATIVIAATAFVVFVLWLFERTASRRVSRFVFAAGVGVIVMSAIVLYQRRDGYRDTSREIVFAEAAPVAASRPIIVVALRGVPYDWLLTAFGEGLLPHLEAWHEGGFATRVEPFRTSSPKAIWASLATGELPSRHGVTGRFSYRTALNRSGERFSLLPSGIGFQMWGLIPPVVRVAPQLPAGESLPFWDCFARMELESLVVNWPGTGSTRPLFGRLVSDRVIRHGQTGLPVEPLPPLVVARLERLPARVREKVIDALSSDSRAVQVALDLHRKRTTALTVVSLNSLEVTLTVTGSNQNAFPKKDSAAGEAARANLILFDRLIEELRAQQSDAILLVVSPSAPTPPEVPVDLVSVVAAVNDLSNPGENDGFLLANGPGFVHRANPEAAEVVDFVPTLLFAAGLPLARDFDGIVRGEALDDAVARSRGITYIASYRPERFHVRR